MGARWATDEQPPEDLRILEAAADVLGLLGGAWRRSAQRTLDREDYSPEVVDHWLRTWSEKRAAADGGTGQRYDSTGGGTSDRLGIAAMLADIERATDLALVDRLHWSAAKKVFLRQGRQIPQWRRTEAMNRLPEPPYPHGHWRCCELLAQQLGWPGYLLAA